MYFRLLLKLVALTYGITCFAAPAQAASFPEPVIINFAPSDEIIPNPERGWWQFAADDFANVTQSQLHNIAQNGLTLTYAPVRLDDYRDKPLPDELLAKLDKAFGLARQEGLKVILRFTYNYPQSSSDYDNAKDAPLDIVLKHIQQFAPVVNKNKDVLTVMQAGLIGAWGEQHTSSNKLDTPENKLIIRDALLLALDPSITIQWRYPRDIISWGGGTMKIEDVGRIGFHNDCFLSSPTDVGTYSEDGAAAIERAMMAVTTLMTFHSGETCDADVTKIRKDCKDILQEGPAYYVSALNLDYYTAFHDNWKRQGCFDEITRNMGYRFALKSARLAKLNENSFSLAIDVENQGWAKLYKNRLLKLQRMEGDTALNIRADLADLWTINAGKAETYYYSLTLNNAPATTKFCLSAPDSEPSLKDDARYAVRFANSPDKNQTNDKKTGQFCFQMKVPN